MALGAAGAIDGAAAMRALLLAPLYGAGVWSGARLFLRAPSGHFRKAALALLLVTGVAVILA